MKETIDDDFFNRQNPLLIELIPLKTYPFSFYMEK
jgi:hypothetical protein